MKNVLIFAAVAEVGTGLALLIVPSLVGQLLLGEELTGIAVPVARVAGIALIALGIACWPGPPLVGMLTYGTLVTIYLAYLGIAVGLTGPFLWPAVALHLVLSILARLACHRREIKDRPTSSFSVLRNSFRQTAARCVANYRHLRFSRLRPATDRQPISIMPRSISDRRFESAFSTPTCPPAASA